MKGGAINNFSKTTGINQDVLSKPGGDFSLVIKIKFALLRKADGVNGFK